MTRIYDTVELWVKTLGPPLVMFGLIIGGLILVGDGGDYVIAQIGLWLR